MLLKELKTNLLKEIDNTIKNLGAKETVAVNSGNFFSTLPHLFLPIATYRPVLRRSSSTIT